MDSPQKSCSQMKITDSAKTCKKKKKKKWFSNSSEHQNYLEGLLNHRLLGPSSRVSFRRTGVEPKNFGTDATSLGTTL